MRWRILIRRQLLTDSSLETETNNFPIFILDYMIFSGTRNSKSDASNSKRNGEVFSFPPKNEKSNQRNKMKYLNSAEQTK